MVVTAKDGDAYGLYSTHNLTVEKLSGSLIVTSPQNAFGLVASSGMSATISGNVAVGNFAWEEDELLDKIENFTVNSWETSSILSSASGYAIASGSITDGVFNASNANDTIAISDDALVLGNIALGGGTDVLSIGSSAHIYGDITAKNLSLTFNLDRLSDSPIITATNAGALANANTKWTINFADSVQNGRYVLAKIENGIDDEALQNISVTVNFLDESYKITFADDFDMLRFADINITGNGEIEFIYSNSFFVVSHNLNGNYITLDSNGAITLKFSSVIDAASFSLDMVSMKDAKGNKVKFTGYSVNGTNLILEYEPISIEGTYTLELSNEIRSVNGESLDQNLNKVLGEEDDAYTTRLKTDFVKPHVTRVEPLEDFAGTLTTLRVYFSEAVKLSTIAANVKLVTPDGTIIEPTACRLVTGNCAELTMAAQTAIGEYAIHIYDGITDLAGNTLDVRNDEGIYESIFHIAQIDLKVSDVELSSAEAALGEIFTVSWTDYNEGGYELFGSWTDGVYLSTDNRWDTGDILLGTVVHEGGLAEGSSIENSLQLAIAGVTEGSYHILVRSDIYMQKQGDRTAAEAAQNLEALPIEITVPKLAVDEQVNGRISANGDFAYYVVHQEANESLQLVLDSMTGYRQNMEIFVGFNDSPDREHFDLSLRNLTDGVLNIDAPYTARDVYIMLNARSIHNPFDYTFTVKSVPVTITIVTPNILGNASDATFEIIGVDFTEDSMVEFRDGNGVKYTPTSVTFINSNRIKADFAANTLPAGQVYSVVVSNETETAEFTDGITVTDSNGSNFTYSITNIPNRLSPSQTFTFNFKYNNTGTDAMDAPLVMLTAMSGDDTGALLSLDNSAISRGFWTSTKAQGFSNSVQILATGTTPGLLQPDTKDKHGMTVPVYYAGWRGGASIGMEIDYYVTVINTDDTTALDWSDMLDGMDMADDYKTLLARNLSVSVGNTWGEYVRMLNDNLIYLDNLSVTVMPNESGSSHAINVNDIFGFEMLQNNGTLSPYRTLQSSADLAVVVPGLGLGISRSYNSDLSSRFTDSSFGYGWSCNWDMALEISSNGDLTFKQGTVSRLYQPNFTNGYQTVAEDGSKMTKLSNGSYKLTERDGTTWLFSSQGVLTNVTDTNGNSITCGYGADGKLSTLSHSSGEKITITRDNAGRITNLADTHGNGTNYTYDANGNLTSVTDATSGVSVTYAYGDSHNLTQVTSIDGNSISYGYNDMGLLSTVSSRNGAAQVSIAYGTHGEVTLTDLQNGNVTYYYGDNGQIVKAVDNTTGISTNYRYDANNQLIAMFDSRGNSVAMTYDANGDLVSMTDQLGNVVKFAYNASGSAVRLTDARGNVTEYVYDTKNNLTETFYSDGTCESYTYDWNGNLLTSTDVKGGVSSFKYDAQGRTVSSTFNGKTTSYAYDGDSNVTAVTWADGTKSRYAYNDFNEMTLFTDAKGSQTAYSYDNIGHLNGITYADGSTEHFAYNAAGDLLQWTNRRGGTVNYTVDALGNTTKLTQSDGTVIEYAYNAQNRLVQSGDLSFTYNDLDYMTTITAADGRGIAYTYDSQDRVVSVSDGVNVTNYTYTVYGELDTLTNGSGALIADYDYDRYGRLEKVTNGNGTYTTYSYNVYGEVTAIEHYGKNGALTGFERYTYNDDSLVATKETVDGTWSYTYDNIGQLTSAVLVKDGTTLRSEAYAYDAMGNRTQSVIDGVETNYAYNNLNQIVSANGFAYRYDADGNLLEDEKRIYTWTTDNRVASETLKSTGQTWTYGYDSLGNRTSVTTNGVTTTYTADANGNVLAEYVNGAFVRSYIQGNSLTAFTDASGNTYYYNSDLLGSTVGLTDKKGITVNTYSYDSFGNVINSNEGVANDFEFVGGYGLMSNASGTTFVRARNYDAVTGRWISADPIGIDGGENLYVYCGNDGGNYLDVNGNESFDPLKIYDFGKNLKQGSGNLPSDSMNWGKSEQNKLEIGERLSNPKNNGYTEIDYTEIDKYFNYDNISTDINNENIKNVKNDKFGPAQRTGGFKDIRERDAYYEMVNDMRSGKIKNTKNGSTKQIAKETSEKIAQGTGTKNTGRKLTLKAVSGLIDYLKRKGKHELAERLTKLLAKQGVKRGIQLAAAATGVGITITVLSELLFAYSDIQDAIEFSKIINEIGEDLIDEYYNSSMENGLPVKQVQSTSIVRSVDPNDKLGNPGYGEANFITPQAMSYTVRFENDPEWATAPARWVRVYDVLDEDFDLDTFQLDSFCLAGNLFTIGNGRDSFNEIVKITIGDDEITVDVKINLDHEARQISADFMAIDPETGTMLMDVTKGLLYPNDETGRGDGDIQYTVIPNEGVENGTKLTNVANIYFDFNDPIETPVVEHTIDIEKPLLTDFNVVSEGGNLIKLTFKGTDADSGIYGYNIAVSTDGENYTFLTTVKASELLCKIELQKEYYFVAQAIDNVGNVSDWSEAVTISQYGFTLPEGYTFGEFIDFEWTGETGAYIIQLSNDNFETSLDIAGVNGKNIEFAGLPEGIWQWRLQEEESHEIIASGTLTGRSNGAEAFVSAPNGKVDLLFAQAEGIWSANYEACHTGNLLNGWEGTHETVSLEGKNIIQDIFIGSQDLNMLSLTDDANGDALFLDDIYSNGIMQSRLSGINEIYAGAGDDIIDFSSSRYSYAGTCMSVHGEDGDDVIWLTGNNNSIWGDAGNDRIIGGAAGDTISGGIGDDYMHGGGGNDIFAFGDGWGNDIVEQLPDGKVTLWFENGSLDNWDASTLTYKDGDNSVKVNGIALENISLKFGDDGSELYGRMVDYGSFNEFSSDRIFRNPDTRGMLA